MISVRRAIHSEKLQSAIQWKMNLGVADVNRRL